MISIITTTINSLMFFLLLSKTDIYHFIYLVSIVN